MENLKDLDKKLNKYLKLSTFPIGVRLLEESRELDKIKFLKRLEEQLVICQIFSYARYYGWTMGCTKEDNLCPLAGISLGFEESHKFFEEGAFFIGRYNETKEAAKKTTASIPKIPFGKYKAIVAGALHRIDFKPDLVLIWGNSAQIMRIIQ